ncbi:hypothetical protein [Dyadobacter sp. MSC1_007]|nr:hypothetical protein [Dyadobacter sp. MSC1_007]
MKKLQGFALLWCGCFESPPDADNGVRTPNAGHFHHPNTLSK